MCECEESIFEGILCIKMTKCPSFVYIKSILPDVSEKEDETVKASDDSENELECQSPIDKSLSNDLENEDENETDNEEPEQVKSSISVC